MIQIKATLTEYEATLIRATLQNHFDMLSRYSHLDVPRLPDIVKEINLLQFEPEQNLRLDAYKWMPATVKLFNLDSELAFTIQLNYLSQFPNSFPLRHPCQREALEGTLLPLNTLSGCLPCPSNTQKSGPYPALLASFEIALTSEDLTYADPPFSHFFPLGIKKGKICFPPSAKFLTPPQPVQQPTMFNYPPPRLNLRQSTRHVSFQNNGNSSYEVRPPYPPHSAPCRGQRSHLSRANSSFPPAYYTAEEDPRVNDIARILQDQENNRRAQVTRETQGGPLLGNLDITDTGYIPRVSQPGTSATPTSTGQPAPTSPLDVTNPDIPHQPLINRIASPPLATSNPVGDQQPVLAPDRSRDTPAGPPSQTPDTTSPPGETQGAAANTTLLDELFVDPRTSTPDSVEMIAENHGVPESAEPRRRIVPASGDCSLRNDSRKYLEDLIPFLDNYSKHDNFAHYLNPLDKENPQLRTYCLPPHLKILNETLLARVNDHPGETPFAARLFPFYTYDIAQQKYLVNFQHLTLDILQRLNSVSKATLSLENPLKIITTRLRSRSK